MKNFTLLIACFLMVLLSERSIAQLTKLSNNTNLDNAISLGNKALVTDNNDSIWVTNGTAAGTMKLVNTATLKNDAVVYKNKIFFAGQNAANGTELWVTDCTGAGTKLLKDINAGAASSSPSHFFVYNNILLFFASTATNGNELWKTDGTALGTVMVKDIYAGKGNSVDNNNPTFFYPAAGTLFFQANDSVHGNELWKTNGNPAGTMLVKDIYTGKKSFQITSFRSLNNMFLFSGKDSAVKGIKIWQSDGTKAGTDVITTILPNSDCSFVNALSFSNFKNMLVFSLQGYIFSFPQYSLVNQLWVTMGTKASTKLLRDLQDNNMGPGFGTITPTIKNKFYFTSFDMDSCFLWESTGTASGTKVTKVLNTSFGPGSENIPIILTNFLASNPDSISTSDFNGKFFIAADDGTHGYEPWITDGTAAGTKLLKDIYPGTGSSLNLADAFTFVYSKQGLYFAANDSITGNELWLSDGTKPGTAEVANIRTGKKSSDPSLIGIVNDHLLVTADDGDNAGGNRDLYKLNATFDTLYFAKADEAVKAVIAPDGTGFSVYPNPVKDQLNVNLNKGFSNAGISLVITDQRGRQLYENRISGLQYSSNYKIDVSALPQGKYYLEVRTGKGIASTGFIKIK
jgi:ELWxxDGT repeat protein